MTGALAWRRAQAGLVRMRLAWSLGLIAWAGWAAENPPPPTAERTANATPAWAAWLGQGNLAASSRYRYEVFRRDQTAFPNTAQASTLRLAVGYETPGVHGFSGFAEFEGVYALGPAGYRVPNAPSQNKLGYPDILDPRASSELNQGGLRWRYGPSNFNCVVTAGRQEMLLNDGRFVSVSAWRQDHQSFDAMQAQVVLPANFGITYAYLDRAYRVVGGEATDGHPPMNSHLGELRWQWGERLHVSAYGVWLDYQAPAQFGLSTRTLGLRCSGPWRLDADWGINYAAEFANQQAWGENPNRVDEDYWLGELGAVYQSVTLKGGIARLGARSATDKLSTPLAHPFNGWTELFAQNPSVGNSHGLEAIYASVAGATPGWESLSWQLTFYDYYAAHNRVHYGYELDTGLIWKVTPVWRKWEVGARAGRYWADQLFGNTLRASLFTSLTY